MKNQNPMQMSMVKARTITDLVPEELSALMIADFPTVGPTVRVCAVGDIGLSGRVENTMSAIGSEAIMDQVAPVLRHADITFGNLEFPLTSDIAHGQLFSAPVTGAALLKNSGFKVLHLANTHVYDYGQAGLMATLEALRKAGLIPLGADDDISTARSLVRTDTNGLRIGWLGCGRTLVSQCESGPSYWEFNEEELVKAVTYNRASVDLLIVSIHTGLMYMDYPRPEHKEMGERLLKSGASVILMHHAHVLQGVQVTFEEGVCCYNLGNFVLDWQEGKVKNTVMLREQNEGAIFHFILDRNGVAQAAALPIWVDDRCIVHWATGMRGVEIINRLIRISRDLECDFVAAFKRQRAERNTGAIFKVIWFHLQSGNWAHVWESLRKARLEHLGMLLRWVFGVFKRFAKGTIG